LLLSVVAILPASAATGTVTLTGGASNAGSTWYSLVAGKDIITVSVADADEQTLASLTGSCDSGALLAFKCTLVGVGGLTSYTMNHQNLEDVNLDDIPDALLIRTLQAGQSSFITGGTSASTGAIVLSGATPSTVVAAVVASNAVTASMPAQAVSTQLSNYAKLKTTISSNSSGVAAINIIGTSVNATTLAETALDTETLATGTLANGSTTSTKWWKAIDSFAVVLTSGTFTFKVEELQTVAARYTYGQVDTVSGKVTAVSSAASGTVTLSPLETGANTGTFTETLVLSNQVAHHSKTGTEIFGISGGLSPITGAHDGAANAAALVDADATYLTAGVHVGDTVTNTSDGNSSCTITGVTATTVTCTLAGGTQNDWDVGDIPNFSDSRKRVYVTNGASVTISYADASPATTITAVGKIDLEAPIVTVSSPSGAYQSGDAPKIQFTVEDVAVAGGVSSGVLVLDIWMTADGPATAISNETGAIVGPTALDSNNMKWSALRQFASGQSEGKWLWWVPVKDQVGNMAAATVVGSGDPTTSATRETAPTTPYSFTIDTAAPTITAAEVHTGGKLTTVVVSGVDDVTTWAADTAASSSISVGFNIGGSDRAPLDPATVQATDFTVTLDSGSAATVSSVAVDTAGKKVLLTLGSALGTNETPKVALSGTVQDMAANTLATITGDSAIEAADDLAPVLTVTCNGVSCATPVFNSTVSISIKSSETTTTPAVVASYIADADGAGSGVTLAAATNKTLTTSVQTLSSTEWKVDIGTATIGAVGTGKLVSVRIDVTDGAANIGSAGLASGSVDATAPLGAMDDNALTFEFDTVLDNAGTVAYTLSPVTSGTSTDSTSPFIEIDFNGEAGEYDEDTHGTVTITKAELTLPDTTTLVDVSANIKAQASDTNSFIFASAGLGLAEGAHILTIQAKDDAGNISVTAGATEASSSTFTFTIVARPKWSKALVPGMNLISLPGAPADSAVNTIFSDAGIEMVMTYDPMGIPSAFPDATRNPSTGLLEGQLTTVDAGHAYWVKATAFVTLSVDIPPAAFALVPATVELNARWNLIPVIDVATSAADTGKPAVTFFASLGTKFATALTWSTESNAWIKIQVATDAGDAAGSLDSEGDKVDDEVLVGRGYWVFLTDSATLVP